MRKVFATAALCAAAIVAISAASGAAANGPLKVRGKASLNATPTNEATPPSTAEKTTSVAVTGKVKTQDTCAARRKVKFIYVTPAGSYPLSETAVTTRKGTFTATLPPPTGLTSKQNGSAVTVSATATQVSRKDKESGEKVRCLEASGINDFAVAV